MLQNSEFMVSRRTLIKCFGILVGASNTILAVSQPDKKTLHSTKYWRVENGRVRCLLCPHGCILDTGKTGLCRTRKNVDGKLVTSGYANPCAVHVDPIEKKPLYHVLPGSTTYSIGIAGCNLRCKNCQNYSMSQSSPLDTDNIYLPPEDAVANALENKCSSIAFTYAEPVVWIEYVQDTAGLARKAGLKTVLVTSGYCNPQPFKELCAAIDCAHIDLKSFDEMVYRNLNAGSISPVLKSLTIARDMNVWTEIVNLIVPSWSDNMEMIRKMCKWIKAELGEETPLHFSRFFPMYKLAHLYPTPSDVIQKACGIAKEEGLQFVYAGNVPELQAHTICPSCGEILIERQGYKVKNHLAGSGCCNACKKKIKGIW
jgi:pyruvate formate lyase activating enzyme